MDRIKLTATMLSPIVTGGGYMPPGHYVVYCNLEGHYLSNMRVGIDVS